MTVSEFKPIRLFVLSTGRSGTKTIAENLSYFPGCVVQHEVNPKLLSEVSGYLKGTVTHSELVELLRETRSVDRIGGTYLSGESNQRLSFCIDAINEAFLNSRYLWLIRDGREVVTSMHHRHWYDSNEDVIREKSLLKWANTRICADQVGEMSSSEWSALGAFGRCCWYWSYTNRVIAESAGRLEIAIRQVRLEQLEQEWEKICLWLGISVTQNMRVKVMNQSSGGKPVPWQSWSRKQRDIFCRYAGSEMDVFYPDWRENMSPNGLKIISAATNRSVRAMRDWVARAICPLRKKLRRFF